MNITFKKLKTYLLDETNWDVNLLLPNMGKNCKDYISIIEASIKDDNYKISVENKKYFSTKIQQDVSFLNLMLSRGMFTEKEHKLLEMYCLLVYNMSELLCVPDNIKRLNNINRLLLEQKFSYYELKDLVNFYINNHFYGDRAKESSFLSTKYIEENDINSKRN